MTDTLSVGDEVAGRRIESEIGRGGMGVVYRVRNIRLERSEALKVISSHLISDASFRERFLRETKISIELEHPHVIPVYDADETAGGQLFFIAMRYVREGATLAHLIASRRRLEPTLALELVADVGSALDAAHAEGLVHRDVKPANILLAQNHHPYLTDFGIAKRVSAAPLTTDRPVVGTLDYMSPEQSEGREVDGRTDVYALGATLYHALSGQVPHLGDVETAKLLAKVGRPPPPISSIADLPAALDEVLARALAIDPADRYRSAGEMTRDASAAMRQTATAVMAPPTEPIDSGTPTEIMVRAAPWSRLGGLAVAGAGAAMIAGMLLPYYELPRSATSGTAFDPTYWESAEVQDLGAAVLALAMIVAGSAAAGLLGKGGSTGSGWNSAAGLLGATAFGFFFADPLELLAAPGPAPLVGAWILSAAAAVGLGASLLLLWPERGGVRRAAATRTAASLAVAAGCGLVIAPLLPYLMDQTGWELNSAQDVWSLLVGAAVIGAGAGVLAEHPLARRALPVVAAAGFGFANPIFPAELASGDLTPQVGYIVLSVAGVVLAGCAVAAAPDLRSGIKQRTPRERDD